MYIHLVTFAYTGIKVSQLPDGRGGKTLECLTHVAKAALTLSHSNAIPELGFSVNNTMLGKEKLFLGDIITIVALLLSDFLGMRLVYPLQKIFLQLQERLTQSVSYI